MKWIQLPDTWVWSWEVKHISVLLKYKGEGQLKKAVCHRLIVWIWASQARTLTTETNKAGKSSISPRRWQQNAVANLLPWRTGFGKHDRTLLRMLSAAGIQPGALGFKNTNLCCKTNSPTPAGSEPGTPFCDPAARGAQGLAAEALLTYTQKGTETGGWYRWCWSS